MSKVENPRQDAVPGGHAEQAAGGPRNFEAEKGEDGRPDDEEHADPGGGAERDAGEGDEEDQEVDAAPRRESGREVEEPGEAGMGAAVVSHHSSRAVRGIPESSESGLPTCRFHLAAAGPGSRRRGGDDFRQAADEAAGGEIEVEGGPVKAQAAADRAPVGTLCRTRTVKRRVAGEGDGYLALVVQLDDEPALLEAQADRAWLNGLAAVVPSGHANFSIPRHDVRRGFYPDRAVRRTRIRRCPDTSP